MALIAIDGVELPSPTTYEFEFSDMDTEKTGRDLNFKLQRSRKRARVYSLSVSWDCLTIEDLNTIVTATDPEFFEVTLLDMVSGQFVTKTMYAGNRKVTAKMAQTDGVDTVGSISFKLIEQ